MWQIIRAVVLVVMVSLPYIIFDYLLLDRNTPKDKK